MQQVEKWFGDIPAGTKYNRSIPAEPPQQEERRMEVRANVPLDALYKCWHMDNRLHHGYYVADLITEVLGGGGSSRLYQALVKENSCSAILNAIISVRWTAACSPSKVNW